MARARPALRDGGVGDRLVCWPPDEIQRGARLSRERLIRAEYPCDLRCTHVDFLHVRSPLCQHDAPTMPSRTVSRTHRAHMSAAAFDGLAQLPDA